MQVRFIGFSVSGTEKITANDLLEDLAAKKRTTSKLNDAGRFIFVDSSSDQQFHLGLIVTVKDQRKFCELEAKGGSFKVKVNNLAADSKLMEFNFFVVSKKTNLGLYQHYHQSCSLGQGVGLLQHQYAALRDSKVASRKNELSTKHGYTNTEKAEKVAKSEFKGNLKWEMLVRKDKLDSVLNELKAIKSLEFDIAFLEPDEQEFRPLSHLVRKQRRHFSFVKTAKLSSLVAGIAKVIQDKGIDNGRVFGVDEDGLDRIIKIRDNPDNFGEFEYDDVAPHINDLDVSMFSSSWVIQQLLSKCKEYRHLFDAEVK